jgi:transposase
MRHNSVEKRSCYVAIGKSLIKNRSRLVSHDQCFNTYKGPRIVKFILDYVVHNEKHITSGLSYVQLDSKVIG